MITKLKYGNNWQVAMELMEDKYGELVNKNELFTRQKAKYENIK